MYAEFILKIVVLQVMFDFGWISHSGTLDPIPLYDIYSQSSTIYVVSTRSKLIMSSVTFKLNLYL